eukprot:RCo013562
MNLNTTCCSPEDVAYVKKHNLAALLEKAVSKVIADKPENPFAFLASEIAKAAPLVKEAPQKKPRTEDGGFTYDYIVIGGGSGGMASAKEAAHLGAKVALFDFVKPSTQGTKWGLGGTCVNVGCVPKKLMHYAGILGAGIHDAEKLGWELGEKKHSWDKLVSTVQNHVHSLNFSYRNGLRSAKVEYINALGRFASPNSVEYKDKDGSTKTLTARHILIAVGGRPHIPEDVPGALEHAITSDDIFSLGSEPGKTLIVGASYIALECAGFLFELGYHVTVAVRSIFLRGFDQQCAEKVASLMEEIGIDFKRQLLPKKITKKDDGMLEVTFTDGSTDTYNTVLYATGRTADIKGLALEKVGVAVEGGKIVTKNEATNVPSIYAVGDAVKGVPELTPAAIRAGELLSRRLFGGGSELMDYYGIPTTVFTPYEYGCCGLPEDVAEKKYGKENLEVFLFEYTTLEFSAAHRSKHAKRMANEYDEGMQPTCLCKLICLKPDNLRVVGFHYVGPNAGELTQGFALSMLLGATKAHFDKVVGIHPTDAEAFTGLSITRASGESWIASGGCGGGKCG